MIDNLKSPFAFVIDTNSYSGNFEREMCAYITGQVGDCGVGGEYAKMFEKESQYVFENINQEHDDNGTARPCTIYPTPGFFNDGFGNDYPENTDPEIVIKKYRIDKAKYYQNILDRIKLIDPVVHKGWTEEGKTQEFIRIEKEVEAAKVALPGHHPSYQSVAILFYKKPTEEEIAVIKERAYKFASMESINILSFRLIQNIHIPQQAIKDYV